MNNQYANISAGGNIDITSDTSITNNAYGASQLLHEVHKTGCFICHVGQMGYRETFGGRIEAKGNINFTANTLANTVTATQNKTFNLPRLDEFHDLRADSNPVPESFVVVRNVKANEVDASEREALVDAKVGTINLDYIEEQTQQTFTQKESLTVSDLDQDTIKIDSVEEPEVISIDNTIIIKKEPVILDFGTYKLSVNTNKPYEKTIETRPTYTNYGAFLSSDYMVKRLQYSPEHENRMNSDEWSLNNSIRSATTISATNINFDIKDKITFEGDVSAKENLTIDTEGNLESSAELKSGATMDIDTGGDFIQSGGGIKAENLNLYTGGDLTLASTKVKAENSISLESKKNLNLDANRQTESGLRGDISWQNSRDIGTVVEANGNINFSSGEDMTLTAATVESKGGVTTLDSKGELNLNSGENYQEHTYTRTSSSSSWGGLKKKKTTTNHHEEHLTHTVTTIKGRDGVNFKGDENINLEGTKAIARTGDIAFNTEGDVNILAVTDKHLVEHDSKTKKSFVGMTYAKAGSSSTLTEIKNQGSISEAMGDISSKAGDTTTLQGAYFKSGGIVTINSSKGIQLLSVQDISDYKSESWSKGTNNYYYPGSLLSSQQKESLQKALTVSTLIDAKEVNLETDNNVVIKGSQIQADTVNFMASYLTLISDKNSESYSNFSDSSGVVVRKILSQGYIKEEAVEAKIDANQITLNGKTLLEDKLNPDSLLKQLSSESNLNHEQIEQIKVELNNKEWNDKTTTLSKMGMIIVQAVSDPQLGQLRSSYLDSLNFV